MSGPTVLAMVLFFRLVTATIPEAKFVLDKQLREGEKSKSVFKAGKHKTQKP